MGEEGTKMNKDKICNSVGYKNLHMLSIKSNLNKSIIQR